MYKYIQLVTVCVCVCVCACMHVGCPSTHVPVASVDSLDAGGSHGFDLP